jgi:hypothetical protein
MAFQCRAFIDSTHAALAIDPTTLCGEGNCLNLGLAAQVIHACLEPLAPRIKVETGQYVHGWILKKDVERLALAHKGSTVSRHVY